MEYVGDRKRTETDRVSSLIRALAVGLMVLGIVFGVLDGSGFLPQPATTVVHDPAS
jgi:hypothetical protein